MPPVRRIGGTVVTCYDHCMVGLGWDGRGFITGGSAGWLHLEGRDYKQAEEAFMALTRDPATKADPYAWLGLAVLNYASAPSDLKKVRRLLRTMPACALFLSPVCLPGVCFLAVLFCPTMAPCWHWVAPPR